MDNSQAISGDYAQEPVVNCFQFLNFMDDSQESTLRGLDYLGCELLSVP